jgi:DNA-binding NarL/FixJ family response regulator
MNDAFGPAPTHNGQPTTGRLPVTTYGDDSLSVAGIAALVRNQPALWLVEDPEEGPALVIVALRRLDERGLGLLREATGNGRLPCVLVADDVAASCLTDLLALGVKAVVRRDEASAGRLVELALLAARGEAALPGDLLGRLVERLRTDRDGRAGPPRPASLTERERAVLELLAEGLSTAEVAHELCYSERTVKNVLRDFVVRHGLANRTHAIAYAIRHGWL